MLRKRLSLPSAFVVRAKGLCRRGSAPTARFEGRTGSGMRERMRFAAQDGVSGREVSAKR